MSISLDDYEVHFHPEEPDYFHIINVVTNENRKVTIDEAFQIMNLMLKNQQELQLIRTGK